jgi:hypothetical protein
MSISGVKTTSNAFDDWSISIIQANEEDLGQTNYFKGAGQREVPVTGCPTEFWIIF